MVVARLYAAYRLPNSASIPGDRFMLKRLLTIALVIGSTAGFAAGNLAPDLFTTGLGSGSGFGPNLNKQLSASNIDVIVRFSHPPTKDDMQLIGSYGQVKNQTLD